MPSFFYRRSERTGQSNNPGGKISDPEARKALMDIRSPSLSHSGRLGMLSR
jgi:hypothetical protein